eukprot:Nk52_evm19s628 gene=Nk52_evmTU19s628
MAERKVLNKYFPPDFDPAKIPRRKIAKDKQTSVRLMAPFNMRCLKCGEFIYKATKFNARKETVEGEEYLGLKVYRFFIRCRVCAAEITFKTDPKNSDYVCDKNCIRNLDVFNNHNILKGDAIAKEEEALLQEEEDGTGNRDDKTNAMKLLEQRTLESKREMDELDALEEIKDMNARNAAILPDTVLENMEKSKRDLKQLQKLRELQEDEEEVRRAFGSNGSWAGNRKTGEVRDGVSEREIIRAGKRKIGQEEEKEEQSGKYRQQKLHDGEESTGNVEKALKIVHHKDISVGGFSSVGTKSVRDMIKLKPKTVEPEQKKTPTERETKATPSLGLISQYSSSDED